MGLFGKTVKFTCPRRHDFLAYDAGREDADCWRKPAHNTKVETCSYCGSIRPEALFEAIDAGEKIGPTDKNYKAYVQGEVVGWGKFYFQHLDEPDCHRFIEKMQDGTMHIGDPGHFYRLPFFIRRVPVNPEAA